MEEHRVHYVKGAGKSPPGSGLGSFCGPILPVILHAYKNPELKNFDIQDCWGTPSPKDAKVPNF